MAYIDLCSERIGEGVELCAEGLDSCAGVLEGFCEGDEGVRVGHVTSSYCGVGQREVMDGICRWMLASYVKEMRRSEDGAL